MIPKYIKDNSYFKLRDIFNKYDIPEEWQEELMEEVYTMYDEYLDEAYDEGKRTGANDSC